MLHYPVWVWFTREGDQVDFDDFFLFADHFGTEQGQPGYDARFDIVANGRIDFGDFFRFADDFGKVVANASAGFLSSSAAQTTSNACW